MKKKIKTVMKILQLFLKTVEIFQKNQMIQSIQTKKVMMKIKITAQKVQRVMLKQTTRLKRTILIVQINQIPLINRIVPVQTAQIVQIILVDLFQNHHMNMFTEFLSLKRFIMMQ